jgi:hypothetical protein
LGHAAESDTALEELIDQHAQVAAYQVAVVHAARSEVDPAFAWLERAYAQRDPGLVLMKTSPPLRSLHGDPRGSAFPKQMGLEA